MYNVFVFFRNEKEKEFFENKCSKPKDDLKFGYANDNYYFEHLQNNLFIDPNKNLIDYINGYCKNIRKFFDDEKKIYNKPLIVAVHPPGKKNIDDLLKWQKEMNKLNKSSNEIIVYYSSNDNENDNVYLKNNEEFNYDYNSLFDTTAKFEEEQLKYDKFNKFLKLLEARAEGKEIEFFDLKKKINNLYHIFCVKALACKGILYCVENGKYENAKDYYSKSFEKKPFKEIVSELTDSNEIKELETIKEYNKGTYDEIKKWLVKEEVKPEKYPNLQLDNLKEKKDLLEDFIKWFVDFQTELIKLKEGKSSE